MSRNIQLPAMTEQHTLPRSTYVLLMVLSLGWGCNWPMMKWALAEIPVWTFRSACVGAGALGMFAIAALRGSAIRIPSGQWPRVALTALCNVTLWNVLTGYGLTMLPAGRSAIIAYTMPLWVVVLSTVVLREPLTRRRLLGVALGMSAMALLVGSELSTLQAAPMGLLLIVAGAFAWALGTVLLKRFPTDLPTTSFTGWQLLLGGLPIMIGALILDWGNWHPVSAKAGYALAYSTLVAFVLCHWVWFKIAGHAPASVSALGTLMIPVVGVSSGMLILGETPGWQEYVALVLVISALATVLIPSRTRA